MKKEDITLIVTIGVGLLTIYSTVLIVQSVNKHREYLENKIDEIKNNIT